MKAFEFEKIFTLPFKFEIPNSSEKFIKKSSFIKTRVKFIKRYLYLKYKKQTLLEAFNILPHHKNILWINISAPSLGDSLMDLSSREMLADRNVDLFTDNKNASIYLEDYYFSSILSNLSEIGNKKYDLVILDSYSTRSVYIKSKLASSTPFVGMFGYYNGPEVNRVLFSFHQMNNLLGYKINESNLNKIAKPSMFISEQDKQLISKLNLPNNFVAIVIGGEWGYRTFNSWDLVIEKLIKIDQKINIVLIGSNNGAISAKRIKNKFLNNQILNYVSKFTFNQTAEIICKAKLVVCCDGGLMHAANAFGVSSVVLLAKLNQEMQLTKANNSFPIYDNSNVNNISIDKIINYYQVALNFSDNHLPGE